MDQHAISSYKHKKTPTIKYGWRFFMCVLLNIKTVKKAAPVNSGAAFMFQNRTGYLTLIKRPVMAGLSSLSVTRVTEYMPLASVEISMVITPD